MTTYGDSSDEEERTRTGKGGRFGRRGSTLGGKRRLAASSGAGSAVSMNKNPERMLYKAQSSLSKYDRPPQLSRLGYERSATKTPGALRRKGSLAEGTTTTAGAKRRSQVESQQQQAKIDDTLLGHELGMTDGEWMARAEPLCHQTVPQRV